MNTLNAHINKSTALLLAFFGLYLIISGIAGVTYIGSRAMTALVSGSVTGVIALTIGHFMFRHHRWTFYAGIIYTLLLCGVFGWRASAAFLGLIHGGTTSAGEAYPAFEEGKAIAFLIIGSMFIISVFVSALQVMFLRLNLMKE